MKKISLSLVALALLNILAFNIYIQQNDIIKDFKDSTKVEKITQISNLINLGIEEAKINNEYNCSTDPVCKTCYLLASKWNDNTAGTCKCAEFIARGEAPCGECEANIKIKEEDNHCNTDPLVPVCDIKI